MTRRIQIVAAAVGGFITALVSTLQVFEVVTLTSEQNGAVGLLYTAAVAVVIAVAEALRGDDTPPSPPAAWGDAVRDNLGAADDEPGH